MMIAASRRLCNRTTWLSRPLRHSRAFTTPAAALERSIIQYPQNLFAGLNLKTLILQLMSCVLHSIRWTPTRQNTFQKSGLASWCSSCQARQSQTKQPSLQNSTLMAMVQFHEMISRLTFRPWHPEWILEFILWLLGCLTTTLADVLADSLVQHGCSWGCSWHRGPRFTDSCSGNCICNCSVAAGGTTHQIAH